MKVSAILTTVTALLLTIQSYAQPDTTKAQADSVKPVRTRHVAWFTPNGANYINGLAVGLQAMPLRGQEMHINGINAEVGLVTMFVFPYFIVDMVSSKKNFRMEYLDLKDTDVYVNGLSLSLGGLIGAQVNGISVSGGFSQLTRVRGLSLTGFSSRINTLHGVQLSGLCSRAKNGTGLQIGLWNRCENLKGIQLGLWNKNGKRSLPFLNWRF